MLGLKDKVNADISGGSEKANKLNIKDEIGNAKKPTYFTKEGLPTACDDVLDVSISGASDKVSNSLKLKVGSTDKVIFDGSSEKIFNIKNGTNISVKSTTDGMEISGNYPEVSVKNDGIMTSEMYMMLMDLYEKSNPLDVRLSRNVIYEKGTTNDFTITIETLLGGKTIVPDRVLVNGDKVEPLNPSLYKCIGVKDSASYKVEVFHVNKVNGTESSATKTFYATYCYPTYFGTVPYTLEPGKISPDIFPKIGRAIVGSANYTCKGINFNKEKFIYAIPTNFGKINSVIDGNGYELFEGFTMTEMKIFHELTKTEINYYVYLSNNQSTETDIMYKFIKK